MISLNSKQRGNFSVEFAIVGVFFALLLVFSADVIVKLSVKGKLDRMAYSAVSVIKERTQLFDESSLGEISDSEIDSEAANMYTIVVASLQRTMSNFDRSRFGFVVHVRQGDDVHRAQPGASAVSCSASAPSSNLSFTTTFGRAATLYQVTLCYDTENWFGHLIGKDFSMVSTNAVTMGR